MNRRLFLFFFLVISTAFYIFEKNSMFGLELLGNIGASKTICAIIMMVFSLIALLLSEKPTINDRLSKRYITLMVYVYVISVIYSIIFPFDSLNIYLLIILPAVLYSFSNRALHYDTNNNLIIGVMSIIFVLLGYNYFNVYYNNIYYEESYAYNASYQILYLLPFVLCTKKSYLRVMGLVFAYIVIILSLKRGGFVAIIAATAIYLYIKWIIRKRKSLTIWPILLIFITTIGVYYLFDVIYDAFAGSKLFVRFEDETGSGRVDIYKYFINIIGKSSHTYILFGHGWRGSVRASGMGIACHNDFLEVLFDFGLIGLVLYAMFIVSLIKLCTRLAKVNHEYAPAMGASLAMFLVNSMVSSIITIPAYLIEFSLFWGFINSSNRNVSNNI